jgi:5,10-methylenetetrahydromethanopterin reductase
MGPTMAGRPVATNKGVYLGRQGLLAEGRATMDFGIALPAAADSWKMVQRAEELGFSHAWFYDTQMLSADCFIAMGAAAANTRRIRLGTGVLVPSNRIAPVTANALASLNKLAPGRIDFGVGTGFTARRAMGFGAMKIHAMETYIGQVYGLLRGEIVDFEMEGERRKICFLNPELNLFNTCDPIPLHLSAFGPRTRALTARLAAGWIDFVGDIETGIREVEAMRQEWRKAGRPLDDLSATAFALGCVLQDGEPADSERAMAQAGPRAAVMLHRAADEALSGLAPGTAMPSKAHAELEGYVALARTFEPADAPYLQNHRGHLMVVKPEERRFVTADLIRATSFTSTEAEIKRRIDALRGAGYTQFTIQLVPGQEEAVADWARIRQAFA